MSKKEEQRDDTSPLEADSPAGRNKSRRICLERTRYLKEAWAYAFAVGPNSAALLIRALHS
jgi:hypothetical protein